MDNELPVVRLSNYFVLTKHPNEAMQCYQNDGHGYDGAIIHTIKSIEARCNYITDNIHEIMYILGVISAYIKYHAVVMKCDCNDMSDSELNHKDDSSEYDYEDYSEYDHEDDKEDDNLSYCERNCVASNKEYMDYINEKIRKACDCVKNIATALVSVRKEPDGSTRYDSFNEYCSLTRAANVANNLRTLTVSRCYNYISGKTSKSCIYNCLTYLPEFIDESIWLINDIECGNIAKYFDYNNSAAEETLEIISECMPGEKDYPKSSGVLSEEALLNMIKDSCGEYDPTIKDE